MTGLRATRAENALPRACAGIACAALLSACGEESQQTLQPSWAVAVESTEAALLSVSGTSAADVWMVGADDGGGPLVLHWDSSNWMRVPTGTRGHLWWVHAFSEELVLAGGVGQILRGTREGLVPVTPPGAAADTLFGVWAASENEVYAVGRREDGLGVLWHDAGAGFVPVATPLGASAPSLFKVWGTSASDVWIVGEAGLVLRGNAADGFEQVASGEDERLFTVHASAGRVVIVGGSANGVALENGESGLRSITPPGAAPLQGACVADSGDVWAVGVGGIAHVRRNGEDEWRDLVPDRPVQSLHAVWIDPSGAAWAAGGNVLTEELDGGVALRLAPGAALPTHVVSERAF